MNFHMMRVISSPSSSTTGLATFIFCIISAQFDFKGAKIGERRKQQATRYKLQVGPVAILVAGSLPHAACLPAGRFPHFLMVCYLCLYSTLKE
jgi:hypothetical protein